MTESNAANHAQAADLLDDLIEEMRLIKEEARESLRGMESNHEHARGLLGIAARLAGLDERARIAAREVARSDRHQAQRVKQLQHALKNRVQVAEEIARRVRMETADPREFADEFSRRIRGTIPEPQSNPLTVEARLKAALTPYVGKLEWNQIGLKGRSFDVSGIFASALDQAAEEMARNAFKHGALRSGALDSLKVTWAIKNKSSTPTFHLTWTERCRIPISASDREGEGSRLLKSELNELVDFWAHVDLRRTGIRIKLRISMTPKATPRKILVVEDEPSVRSGFMMMLQQVGYEVSDAASVEEALAILDMTRADESRPAAAVLDHNLGSEKSFRVAEALDELSIPYLMLSGEEASDQGAKMTASKWLTKPVKRDDLVAEIKALVPVGPLISDKDD